MKTLISSISILAIAAGVATPLTLNNHKTLSIDNKPNTQLKSQSNVVSIANKWTHADISTDGGATWIENYDLTNATGIRDWNEFKSNHTYFAFNGGSDDEHLSTSWLKYQDVARHNPLQNSHYHSIVTLAGVVNGNDFYSSNYYLGDSGGCFSYGTYWHYDTYTGHLMFSVCVYMPSVDYAYDNGLRAIINVNANADWWA